MCVSEKTVFGRLKRYYKREGLTLRKSRHWTTDTGWLYTTTQDGDCITDRHLDLEAAAREAGVLRPSEQVASE